MLFPYAEAAQLRLAVFRDLRSQELLARAMRQLSANARSIGNLNITTKLRSSPLKEQTS